MNAPAIIPAESLPALIDKATAALANARTSAEVLEARDMASVAYDAAKSAARMARKKQAYDSTIADVHRAQGYALSIRARAEIRLAEEYDAAQERVEVAGHGQRGPQKDVAEANVFRPATAADLGLRRDEIHEARKLRDAELASPGIVETTINELVGRGEEPTKAKLREAVETVVRPHVAHNSGNNEWYTPPDFLAAARAVLGGFDLDPASSEIANRTVGAARIFTAEDDGLSQEWPVGRIWMNPPYAQPLIGDFSKRFAAEIRRGSSGIVLVNNATETQWFQTLAQVATAICFPQGRIKFLDPQGNASGAPLQGQAVIYAGPDAEAFCATFAAFGFVVRHDGF